MLGVQRFVLDRVGNPVLEWELLQRRKSKAYVVGTRIVYGLYFLFIFTSTALILFWDPRTESKSNALLEILGWLPVCVIFLVVPVLAAVSVVGERRSRTLEFVQLSLLRPFDIVWGKVVASITPILVFAFGLVPLALLSFFPGNNMYRLVRDRDDEYQFLRDDVYWFLFLLADNAVFLAVVVLAMVIVFTVSAFSVLVSTFAKSSPAAVAVSYGMAFMFFVYLLFLIPESYTSGHYYHLWSTKVMVVYCVFVAAVLSCAAGLFVWWACKRLRLPVVSTSAKSSAATIPMSRVAVPVSLFVALILLLLAASPFLLVKALLLALAP